MRQKFILSLIPITGVAILLLLLGTLRTWSAQAAPNTRYVALQNACSGRSPCYADVQAAVDDSNPGDEILVAEGIYSGVQTAMVNGSVYSQALFIDKNITIQGGFTTTTWVQPDPTTHPTILDAQDKGRGVYIAGSISVTLEGLGITNGRAYYDFPNNTIEGGGVYAASANVTISNCQVMSSTGSSGAGISNAGVLTLTNSMIADNYGSSMDGMHVGGGIHNQGSLYLYLSTIMSNTAAIAGGIHNVGEMKITASTLRSNRGEGTGKSTAGGILNSDLGSLDLVDSTVMENSSFLGGGILNRGAMTITNATVSGNWSPSGSVAGIANVHGELVITNATIVSNTGSAPGIGGGIHSADIYSLGVQPVLSITNSIVSHNNGSNCGGVITSLGHNLEDSSSCRFIAVGDLSNTSPMLDALGYYGGPTLVVGLLPSSPAVDAGDDAACPATDQRGVSRDQGMRCDIGAFELESDIEIFSLYSPIMLNQSH